MDEQTPVEPERPRARTGLRVLTVLFALSLIAFLIAGVVLVRNSGERATGNAQTEEPEVGTLEGVHFDGFDQVGATTLGSFRGRPLVLNFFATWCAPCIKEMPELQRVHRDLQGRVNFLGVDINDEEAAAIRLVAETGVTYRIASDRKGEMFRRMGAYGMPTTFFITSEGEVAERFSGPLTENAIRERIEKHFGVR